MSSRVPWVIFDADNTLWAVEHLYDEARAELCHLMQELGANAVECEEFQQRRDKELHVTYGYSACRFARSFEDTLLHFFPDAAAESVRQVRGLALDVFEQHCEPAEGLEEVLQSLKSAGYALGIITAGERWVQERRLAAFHLCEQFSAVEIVDAKSEEVFLRFCDKWKVNVERSWVVGDSIRSDIIPARKAHLKAVLLDAHNWRFVERQSSELPNGTPVVRHLKELYGLLCD